jgi:glucose/arabinose dehydrogenase/DNA-directed RNA polymerase subunit RPC12/RpoP
MTIQALRCPHCNAPLTSVDGKPPTECPYCKSVLDFSKPQPPMSGPPPRGSGAGGIAIVLVVALIALTLCGGITAWLFFVRTSDSTATSVAAVSVPAPTPAPPVPAMPVKPPEPPSPVKQVLTFGEAGTNPGQLSDPNHLAVMPDGSIFVAEGRTGRVQKFDATGKYVDVIQLSDDKLTRQHGVFGMTSDAKGNLYVNRVGDILVFDGATLKLTRTIAGDYPDKYFHGGLAADAKGTVYALTDRTGDVDLLVSNEKGKQVSRHRVHAYDVAIDGTGRVFLVGEEGVEVQDAKGAVLTKVGGVSGRSIAFDGKGHVFVGTGSRLEVLSAEGTKVLSHDMSAGEIALDASGKLYVLERDGVHVYEVTLP